MQATLISRRFLIDAVTILIVFSALLDGIVAWKMAPTTDEQKHLQYGVQILHSRPDRFALDFDSQMPVSALNAVPKVIASSLDQHRLLPRLSAFLRSNTTVRLPTVLATLALTLMVCLWAYDLYGPQAALAATLLCVLSPNLIAHGTLVTDDMYHALGVVGSLFFFRRFLLRPTWTSALVSGLTLGLAQIAKPFALSLYVVVCVALALATFTRFRLKPLTPRYVGIFALIAAVSFLGVINLAYSFDRTFTRLNAYTFRSGPLTRLQSTPVLAQLPVPLPYPFLQGLDMMKYGEQTGNSLGNIYLLGTVVDSHSSAFKGFKSYYAVALFFKEPIALQILFFCGLFCIWRKRRLEDFLFGEGLLLAAAGILVFWLSFFSRAQIGIRHILPALAVEIVMAAATFSNFSALSLAKKVGLSVLVLWLAGSVASYYPHMIPYMNEWVRDRRLSYRILADSNLDWGQDAYVVNDFLHSNRDVILDPPGPVAGRILVSANRLTGVDRWDPPLTFLAKRYTPVAQVGYAHFLFVVPASDLPALKAERFNPPANAPAPH